MPQFIVRVQDQTLSAGTVQTLWQIATGASREARLVEWSLSFDGTSPTDVPAKVELLRQTTTGTGSAFTLLKLDPDRPAAQSSARTAYTSEPTASDSLAVFRLTPNNGILVMQYAFGREPVMPVSSYLGLRVTANATVNATAYAYIEE